MEAQTHAQQMIEGARQQIKTEREREVAEGRKEANTIIAEAKLNAEKLTSEAIESARKTAEAERAKILAEAQENATSQAATIVSDSWRRSQEMLDAAEVAYNLVRGQIREFGVNFTEAERRTALALKIPEGQESEPVPTISQPTAEAKAV